MNSGRSNNLILKYLRLKPSSYKDIRIWNFDFVAKTQLLFNNIFGESRFFYKIIGGSRSLWNNRSLQKGSENREIRELNNERSRKKNNTNVEISRKKIIK